jgi:hypothetical protein
VCRLSKALYGLKQASRQSHAKLKDVFVASSLKPSDAHARLVCFEKGWHRVLCSWLW